MSNAINRREFLGAAAAWSVAAPLAGSLVQAASSSERRKPNIIFIMADDMGYGEVGCYGQKQIKTPNIDALARQGRRFTQCYAGSTVCAPSRCCLMTGMHTGHAVVRGNKQVSPDTQQPLPPNTMTVARLLKDAGYRTGIIGKWGLGGVGTEGIPTKQGFDYQFGYLEQVHAHTYWTDHLFRNDRRIEIPPKTYSHDLMTREALEFVQREKNGPFFLYLAYTIPHAKFDPPTDEPYTNENWPQVQKNIAAMITRMDRDIGRLMDLLKDLGLEKDTILFFTSDNGPRGEGAKALKSSGPLRGVKRDMYEGGIRVPMIARWPGRIPEGTTSDHPWAFWDFLPTAAEIAGTSAPKDLDGMSVLPALLGRNQPEHEFFYWEFHERGFQQAVRMGKWKAVRLAIGAPLELYDLSADPSETKNIAGAHPEVIRKIEDYLKSARSESEEWVPKPARKPNANRLPARPNGG